MTGENRYLVNPPITYGEYEAQRLREREEQQAVHEFLTDCPTMLNALCEFERGELEVAG